ncbi:MAG: hypothetical protein JZU50_14080, partial [Desulfobulbaceae bacterium]|nr:hypothetical protein [Desulfobulbaceae bacterium]
ARVAEEKTATISKIANKAERVHIISKQAVQKFGATVSKLIPTGFVVCFFLVRCFNALRLP